MRYIASGAVRGDCGHQHKSIAAAQRCADRDGAACARLPGGNSYSDRTVRRADNLPLDDWELDELHYLHSIIREGY